MSSSEEISCSSSSTKREVNRKKKRISKKIDKIEKKKKRSRSDSKSASLDRDSWGTPLALYKKLDEGFHFVADMAASDKNHLHPTTYFTRERSAFFENWSKIDGVVPFGGSWVFINPPYSKVEPWLEKAVVEWRRGVSILMLLKCPNGESYWQENVEGKASEFCFIRGRLKFRHPETLLPQKGCNFGTCLVMWDACEQNPGVTRTTFLDARSLN
jgi:phage N-6-adenine-methyltransferase